MRVYVDEIDEFLLKTDAEIHWWIDCSEDENDSMTCCLIKEFFLNSSCKTDEKFILM